MHYFDRTHRALVGAAAAFSFCTAFVANARELDPDMKSYVIANCSTDAYRLCPQALGNEVEAVKCMKTKRKELNQTCRVAYDKVVRILAQ